MRKTDNEARHSRHALPMGLAALVFFGCAPVPDVAGTDGSGVVDQGKPASDAGSDQAPAPTCSDGIKNGAESDTDCGGTCAACADGAGCAAAGDCTSGVCS